MLKTALLTLVACCAWNQLKIIDIGYDEIKNVTTVSIPQTGLATEKGRYQRVWFSIDYSYRGKTASPPAHVNFELMSVVKARRLNPDLHVLFVVDGKPVHFSSNRSAIRNPVPGRPWIGEKMVFLIPREEFLKLAASKNLAIKMGDVTLEFDDELRGNVRALAETIER